MTADTTVVDPCPHVCAACGSCPDCCPERHKSPALAELVSQGRHDSGPGFLIVDTQAENYGENWKAIAEQLTPDNDPTL